MITVGAKETEAGTEYFAVFGGWASERSYPGVNELRKACAECIAYQEWLLGRRQQTFDKYWEQYWLDLESHWTGIWEQDHWSAMLSPEFADAIEFLSVDAYPTMSPFAKTVWSSTSRTSDSHLREGPIAFGGFDLGRSYGSGDTGGMPPDQIDHGGMVEF